jgi:hypothetical protein
VKEPAQLITKAKVLTIDGRSICISIVPLIYMLEWSVGSGFTQGGLLITSLAENVKSCFPL